MKDKINVAELLKDCPKGMELDCAMFENVTFIRVDMSRKQFPIEIAVSGSRSKYLTKEGCFHDTALLPEAKCIIFPKGKTTWEEFQRPFKDGDILSYQFPGFENRSIYIYRNHPTMNTSYYVALSGDSDFIISYREGCALNGNNNTARLATEEEKEKLFRAIKDNGYKWNAETKTLQKLPKFKVGDRIRHKNDKTIIKTIGYVYYDSYALCDSHTLLFKDQDEWELVPNKFDINTLKPFDKVLVRTKNFTPVWTIDFYDGYQPNVGGSFTPFGVVGGKYFQQCIPYEGNEHLRGTTKDCDEYFKNWK